MLWVMILVGTFVKTWRGVFVGTGVYLAVTLPLNLLMASESGWPAVEVVPGALLGGAMALGIASLSFWIKLQVRRRRKVSPPSA